MMMDAILQGLKKNMESARKKMQDSQNHLAKATKYLKRLESNALPQIERLKREHEADHSRMVNFYKTMVNLQADGKKSSAKHFSKEGAKFKEITKQQQYSIKVLSLKIESAIKCMKRAEKEVQKTTKSYTEASRKYSERKNYICSLEELSSSMPPMTTS